MKKNTMQNLAKIASRYSSLNKDKARAQDFTSPNAKKVKFLMNSCSQLELCSIPWYFGWFDHNICYDSSHMFSSPNRREWRQVQGLLNLFPPPAFPKNLDQVIRNSHHQQNKIMINILIIFMVISTMIINHHRVVTSSSAGQRSEQHCSHKSSSGVFQRF